jgi:tetratricopeptide (TPR) repeat protein
VPEKPSHIRCPKCGDEPNIISDTCLKCGAALEKKCGACGFSNSVEKNYCDQCGTPLGLQVSVRMIKPSEGPRRDLPRLEIQDIQDSVSERDLSFRGKTGDAPPPPPPPRPQAAPKNETAKIPDHVSDCGPAHEPAAARSWLPARYAVPAAAAGSLALLAALAYLVVLPFLPRWQLTRAAGAYLSDLAAGRYAQAYEKLSTNSKNICSLEEYTAFNAEYYEKRPAWEFRDPQIFRMDKNAAIIKYQLREAGGEWKPDYISFVQEHGRWTRPYIWMLFQPIDDALARRDFPQALFLAQKLYLTDPMDPRASGYLCAAEFFMGLHEKSAESCRRTIETAASVPVGYTTTELYWFNLYYADSLRYLERNRSALEEYEKMLKLPNLSSDEQCPVFLNRADVYVNIKDYERGFSDVMRAVTVCTQSPAREDAARRRQFMSGEALEEAVDFARKTRLAPEAPPVAAARRRQVEALAAQLGPKGARLLPQDKWSAEHLVGPEYRVFLRAEATDKASQKRQISDIFVFTVNLWTRQGKVEKLDPGLQAASI